MLTNPTHSPSGLPQIYHWAQNVWTIINLFWINNNNNIFYGTMGEAATFSTTDMELLM